MPHILEIAKGAFIVILILGLCVLGRGCDQDKMMQQCIDKCGTDATCITACKAPFPSTFTWGH